LSWWVLAHACEISSAVPFSIPGILADAARSRQGQFSGGERLPLHGRPPQI
jgi:hypothetical protein